MRKCYLIALLLFCSSILSAQVQKGSVLLGGQLNFSTAKNVAADINSKSTGGTIAISIGKAINENTVLGLNISFSPREEKNVYRWIDTADISFQLWSYGVYLREYKRLAKGLLLFGQGDAGYMSLKQTEKYKNTPGDLLYRQQGAYLSLAPGMAYQLFKKMQVELMLSNLLYLQYTVTKTESEIAQVPSTKRNEFSFNSNLNNNYSLGGLGIGFRFVL
jgi:hypothetical protein